MIQSRSNAAESLDPVLELVRIRRLTGLVSVERIHGGRFEEGEIYFQAGQPIYARTGQLSGQEALMRLLGWRRVYFSFSADQSNLPALSPAVAARQIAFTANDSTPPRLGANDYPDTSLPATTFPRLPQANARGVPGEGNAHSQNMVKDNTSTAGLELLIPKKLGGDRNVLSLPLTRPQRSIYMLVDGRRTIADLSRCTRKSIQEIEWLLGELRQRGLITI